MDWKYKGKIITEVPEGMEAFVYVITFQDGSKYVGKKNFYSTRRVRVKGKARRQVKVTESNWKTYMSSSTVVKEKLAAGHKLKSREIVQLTRTKGQATYEEVKYMFLHDVLCCDNWLNANILSRFFRSICD